MPETAVSVNQIIAGSQIAFGTSGARGPVERFNDDVCAAFTVAFLEEMRSRFSFRRVAVGMDRRPSSPRMASAVIGASRGLGLQVDYYGVLPTPALARQSMADGIPAIMITGSHIPFDRNGIKFYRPDGEINKEDEGAIKGSQVCLPAYRLECGAFCPRATETYVSRYAQLYSSMSLNGLRIGLYEHSAAGRDINRDIFERLGATVISLGRTDSFVPIDTEAVSEKDRLLGRKWSKEHKLDAIFSTDGDGDRPLLADEHGEWLRGDVLGLLCALGLGVEALAVPISCNTAIELCGDFRTITRTRIGSPYVIEAMDSLCENYRNVAGFEANGGFLTGSDICVNDLVLKALPTRDAILPALIALATAVNQRKTLAQLIADLPERYTASDRITDFPQEKSDRLVNRWIRDPESCKQDLALTAEIESMNLVDGLRVTMVNRQIVHIRPSGNAPELRCYCEAETQDSAYRLLRRSLKAIKEIS